MKKLFLIGLIIILSLPVFAQTFSAGFVYDANGNRVQASVIYLQKSAPASQPEVFLEEKFEEDLLLRIFPNPTRGLIRIELLGNFDDVLNAPQNRISVYDFNGRTILNIAPVNISNEIDLSNYPDGVYIITFEAGKVKKTYKIIKQ